MWKRIMSMLLCVILLYGLTVSAVEPRWSVQNPQLEFDGTTAYCSFTHSSMGDTVTVIMRLLQGDTLVDSWTQTGVSKISMSETCQVSRLKMYTLEVSGTCGGVSFGPVTVSKRCPLFG